MATTTELTQVPLDLIVPYERNAKKHPQDQVDKIKASMEEFGFVSPCLIDRDYNLIAGHGRVEAAKALGYETVPCVFVEGLTDTQRRAYILADNRLTEIAEWDEEMLGLELYEIGLDGFDVTIMGFDPPQAKERKGDTPEEAYEKLTDRFVLSPFSVMDSRQSWWQNRKRAWRDLGIRSEVGRGEDGDVTKDGLIYSKSHQPVQTYKTKERAEEILGRTMSWDEFAEVFPNAFAAHGQTSVFDPVLCEIAYRWYSKTGDRVLDPFAGGSVRGITAALLGRKYTGIDLSERQVLANRANWEEIEHLRVTDGETAEAPVWHIGDSLEVNSLVDEEDFDLLFTCPPYADLEVYSDDPRDISNMDYEQFCEVYSEIIKRSVAKLKRDAFAVCVVGDVRDRDGFYRDFVSYTIKAFEDAGMRLYNEGILVTSTGMVAVVVGRQFEATRKTGKVHQNVLIFADDRGELHTIQQDEPEETEKEVAAYIEEQKGKLPASYTKVLTFAQGDPKARTEELGDVEVEETFEVEL